MSLIIPQSYDPVLSVRETQEAIKYIRDTFQKELGRELNLSRISAPLFVKKSSGLNDNLNGVEQPVHFSMQSIPNEDIEIVHSLAKWKRFALKKYNFEIRSHRAVRSFFCETTLCSAGQFYSSYYRSIRHARLERITESLYGRKKGGLK